MNTEFTNNTKKVIVSRIGAVALAALAVFGSAPSALAAPTVQGVTLTVEQITVKSSPAVNTPHGMVYFPAQMKATKRTAMYAEANTSSALKGYIPESTLMTGTSKSGDFYAVTLPHGDSGYVAAADVVVTANYYGSDTGSTTVGGTSGISTGDDAELLPAPDLWHNGQRVSLAQVAASKGEIIPEAASQTATEATGSLATRDDITTGIGDRFHFTVNSTKPADVGAISYIIYPSGGSVSYPVLEGRVKITGRTASTATVSADIDTRSISRGQYVIIFWTESERYTSQDNASTRPSESTKALIQHSQTITCGIDNPDPEYISVDRATGNIRCITANNTALFSDKAMTNQSATLQYADVVELIHTSGNVSKIYVNNKAYFVPSSALMTVSTLKSQNPSKAYAAGAVEWGLLQRGCAYVLGGNGDGLQIGGRGVYDCSGLLWRCYRTGGGLNWDRTTAAGQLVHGSFTTRWVNKYGPEYDRNNFAAAFNSLKPGDLIAFQTAVENDRLNNVTHIGMYVGNGRMVHAGEPVHVEYMGDYSLHVGNTKYGKIRGISRVK